MRINFKLCIYLSMKFALLLRCPVTERSNTFPACACARPAGRLTEQKGVDIVLSAVPALMSPPRAPSPESAGT